jgi:addiction module HigA family antidote
MSRSLIITKGAITMSRSKKLPPIHPGEILLEEFLKPLGMSMNKLATEFHVPANRITQIVEGDRSITGETALRLARYFGTAAEFWLGMQKDYDLQLAHDEFEAEVERQVHPRDKAA